MTSLTTSLPLVPVSSLTSWRPACTSANHDRLSENRYSNEPYAVTPLRSFWMVRYAMARSLPQ